MIVWVFFEGGAGGDGVANLLEHASNSISIDSEIKWRIHRYVDNAVKFWAPNLPGLTDRKNTVNQLTAQHIEIANSNDHYLIVTSHDLQFTNVFLNSILPNNKNIKLLLTYNNYIDQQINFLTKNLIEFNRSKLKKYRRSDYAQMDFILNIDAIHDWKYLNNIVSKIGLKLDQKDFEDYKKIVLGELIYTTPGIEYYKSYVNEDNITKYQKIN